MGRRTGEATTARAVVLGLEIRDISRAMEYLAALAYRQGHGKGWQDGARAQTGKRVTSRRNPYLDSAQALE